MSLSDVALLEHEFSISLSPAALHALYPAITDLAATADITVTERAAIELANFRNEIRSRLQRYDVYVD